MNGHQVRCTATNLGAIRRAVRAGLFRADVEIDGPNFLVPPGQTVANLAGGGAFVRCVFTVAGPTRDVRAALLVQDANDRTILTVEAR